MMEKVFLFLCLVSYLFTKHIFNITYMFHTPNSAGWWCFGIWVLSMFLLFFPFESGCCCTFYWFHSLPRIIIVVLLDVFFVQTPTCNYKSLWNVSRRNCALEISCKWKMEIKKIHLVFSLTHTMDSTFIIELVVSHRGGTTGHW